MQHILIGLSASNCDGLDSFEGWIAECLNDPEMTFTPDDMYASLDYSFFV